MSDKLEKIQQLMPLGKMQEVKALVDGAYARCGEILTHRRRELDIVAEYLLQYENMDAKTFEMVFTGEDPLPPPADSSSSGVDAGPDLLPEVTGAKPRKSAEVPAPQSDASEESDGEE